MILSTLTSNQSTPAESLVGVRPAIEPQVSHAAPDHASSHLQIHRVVSEIESPPERQLVGAIFQDLLRLLECLSLIETHLRQVDAAAETFALFQIIHDEARVLVDFIREDGLSCVGTNEDLFDSLDGITFAVNHDLQRVFETPDSAANKIPNPSPHVVLGKLYRAHDILTNCLQQSTITLAMMFDPELVGTRLFNNSDLRYRQSLQLCQDLSALTQLVQTAEKPWPPNRQRARDGADSSDLSSLTAGIEKFRNESMACLMYSDWPQFESFCERIKVPATSAAELAPVLHQFRCYLETLLGQVRMRAVLANVFPIQFGANDVRGLSSSTQNTSASLYAPIDFQDGDVTWAERAIAV